MSNPRKRKKPSREPKASKHEKAQEPAQSPLISPTLWRDSLTRLRADFLSAREKLGPLRCPLFQTSTSKADAQEPPFDVFVGHIAIYTVVYHGSRQFVGKNGKTLYFKHPIVDLEGKPITDSQGRGIMCAMPTKRTFSYHGSSEACQRLIKLAVRGGRTLQSSPKPAIAWVPFDTLRAGADENRWVFSIFDLAWQGRHPALQADRKTWFRWERPGSDSESQQVLVPYDLQKIRTLSKNPPSVLSNLPEEWAERLPGFFISELPDLFQASADLIDVLLDLAAQTVGTTQSGGDSTAGKHVDGLALDANLAGHRETSRSGSKSAGGRKPLPEEEARRREQLVKQWNQAKAAGICQKDFCDDGNVSLRYLVRCINWAAQRRRRTNGP